MSFQKGGEPDGFLEGKKRKSGADWLPVQAIYQRTETT